MCAGSSDEGEPDAAADNQTDSPTERTEHLRSSLSVERLLQESPKDTPTNLSRKPDRGYDELNVKETDYDMVEKDKDDSRCDLPPEVYLRDSRLFARDTILRGKRYGPFAGQLLPKPINERFAVEVSCMRNSCR